MKKLGVLIFIAVMATGLSIRANAEQIRTWGTYQSCEETTAQLNSVNADDIAADWDEIDQDIRNNVLVGIFSLERLGCDIQVYQSLNCDMLNHGYRLLVESINRYYSMETEADDAYEHILREIDRNQILTVNRAISNKPNCEMYGMSGTVAQEGRRGSQGQVGRKAE